MSGSPEQAAPAPVPGFDESVEEKFETSTGLVDTVQQDAAEVRRVIWKGVQLLHA